MIDDEILAIQLFEHLLQEMDGVQVVGKFTSYREGLETIKELNPDVIFLDIEMPGQNGIAIAEQIMEMDENIDIVFVTAYDQYALDAFRVHAVDYLLKPTEKERLETTINKIIRRRKIKTPMEQTNPLLRAQFMGNFFLYDYNGEPIKWRTKKVKELCAYFLQNKNIPVHKDQIMEEIWPLIPIDKGSIHLHTSIYQLRKIFKDLGLVEPIDFIDDRYKLNVEILCDIDPIKSIIDGSCIEEDKIILLLEFYQNDYLENEDYPWSIGQKNIMRKTMIDILEKFAKKAISEKKSSLIVQRCLEKLVELDTLEEHYTQLLIKYLLTLNRRKEAIDHYNNFKELIWVELNETPKNTTIELVKKFL